MHSKADLTRDEEGLVGVGEDIIALSVVLIGFTLFIATVLSSLGWADEVDERQEFSETAIRVASELAVDEELRYSEGEPGVLGLTQVEDMRKSLAEYDGVPCEGTTGCDTNLSEFALSHSLVGYGYSVTIRLIEPPEQSNFASGFPSGNEGYNVTWGDDLSDAEAGVQQASEVYSARRLVNIVDPLLPERVAAGYILVVVWR